ncbi:MAG: hypothetical protein IPL46_09730 [Saprospiraceae bacterium]|nr:hypothetical protein [Saprospiraceae bacterium]
MQSWEHYLRADPGIVRAPTGRGKTYSLVVPITLEGLMQNDWEDQIRK